MKKRIEALVIVCLLLWVGQAAFAQESKWRLGVRVSPALAFASITDPSGNALSNLGIEKSPRLGFSGGLQVTYQFTEKFGLHTGLQVNIQSLLIKTVGVSGFISGVNLEQKINLTFLQIPLALHLRTNELGAGLRVRGLFGSALLVPVSASQKFTVGSISSQNTRTIDLNGTSNYATIIPNFLVGAGVEWNLGDAGTLDLGVSYQLPLSATTNRLYDNPERFLVFGDARLKMSYVALDITYYF